MIYRSCLSDGEGVEVDTDVLLLLCAGVKCPSVMRVCPDIIIEILQK